MDYYCLLNVKWFALSFRPILFLLVLSSSLLSRAGLVAASSNETDRLALLDFKSRITQDPLQAMNSWNDSLPFCDWVGIKCNKSNGRAVLLKLESLKLVGSIPPSVGNLTFLTRISLANNNFHGQIPQELGRLLRLQNLTLRFNSFSGTIPTNLTHCTNLTVLDLVSNVLIGPIPDQPNSLSRLDILFLDFNQLTGRVPSWIGNCSLLRMLSLTRNNLYGGIPSELGRLSNLQFFQLYANQLYGTIPRSIFNISTLYFFTVAQNQLHGHLPPDVGLTLPNLQVFAGGVNNFSGLIPVSLSNASKLGLVDFAENSLTGTVPPHLGNLQGLYWINFDDNRLGYQEADGLHFVASLGNCTNLEVLGFQGNVFGGELPNSIANLSTNLKTIALGSNSLHGTISNGIENLVNLRKLGLENNYLTGNVPHGVGKLQQLQGLSLNNNKLSGLLPSSLGNLTSLTELFIQDNRLEETIPSSLENCRSLLVLNLSNNKLSGIIPREVMGLSSLSISLALAYNSLSGSLPLEVGNLIHLKELSLSGNKLSGEIPSTLANCLSLEVLLMEGNQLHGTIPASLKALRGLKEMDISHNNLSGQLPEFLQTLASLNKLYLSFNNFEGDVYKEGIFSNATAVSLVGNDKLCGGLPFLNFPQCDQRKSHSSKLFSLKVVIPVIFATLFIITLSCYFVICFVLRYSRKTISIIGNVESTIPGTEDWQLGRISYEELVKATNNFSEGNVIGSGSFGVVYKGIFHGDDSIVAIKVLRLDQQGATESFIDECKTLSSIKHRNLLKILSACSSVDHQGNEFKCLLFPFMPNGNLDQWLHQRADQESRTSCFLNITQRLNIAIDVASALDYLHHYCEAPIVHCDLKPSNILLDDDMTAHVGDFGLAKSFIKTSFNGAREQAGLKGSIGYIPPEYGLGAQVSRLGDVYSYGILLLEMFTGKRPTDDIFKDGLSIQEYVTAALPEHVMDIVDTSLLLTEREDEKDEEEEEECTKDRNGDEKMDEIAIISEGDSQLHSWSIAITEECLVSVMRIGLSCSAPLPMGRIPMNIVVNKMHSIRESFLQLKKGEIRRRSPRN